MVAIATRDIKPNKTSSHMNVRHFVSLLGMRSDGITLTIVLFEALCITPQEMGGVAMEIKLSYRVAIFR